MTQESRVILDPVPKGPPLMVIWPHYIQDEHLEVIREALRQSLEEGKPMIIENPGTVFQLIGDRWEKLA